MVVATWISKYIPTSNMEEISTICGVKIYVYQQFMNFYKVYFHFQTLRYISQYVV